MLKGSIEDKGSHHELAHHVHGYLTIWHYHFWPSHQGNGSQLHRWGKGRLITSQPFHFRESTCGWHCRYLVTTPGQWPPTHPMLYWKKIQRKKDKRQLMGLKKMHYGRRCDTPSTKAPINEILWTLAYHEPHAHWVLPPSIPLHSHDSDRVVPRLRGFDPLKRSTMPTHQQPNLVKRLVF